MKRAILVTGGNRGIGLAVVRRLAEQGHAVLLGSRDPAEGARAAKALQETGRDVTPVQVDLNDAAVLDAALAGLAQSGHIVDALVNNAGVLHEAPLLELADAEIAEALAVHLTGPLRLVRALAPGMIARGYGRVVNVSSGWGSFGEGLGGPGDYGITKAAMNALTVRLAKELAPAVKVNAMCPGWVQTRMGGEGAPRTPDQGADTAVWLATLPESGPTGGFFRDRKRIPW